MASQTMTPAEWTMPMTRVSSTENPAVPSWSLWLCPLLSAVLLYLSYFPVAIGALAWVALIPFFVLVRMPGRPRRLYLACWIAALLFCFFVLSWVRVADPMMNFAWIALAIYGSLYWPVALALLRWVERRTPMPLVVSAPMVWVALEYTRYGLCGCFVSSWTGSHRHDIPGGFAWYLLGHTQHDFLELIQLADVTGAYGVTALVVLVNAILFEILCGRVWFRRIVFGADIEPRTGKMPLLVQGVLVVAILLLALAYGVWRINQPIDSAGPRLAILQTNSPQDRRNAAFDSSSDRREQSRRLIADDFTSLAHIAAAQRADLIVTPETSYPGIWCESESGKPTEICQELARRMNQHMRVPVLVGMNSEIGPEGEQPVSYNSSVLIGEGGAWLGRYDKIHRVPFGEYIPMRSVFPFLKIFAPYDYDYEVAPGEAFMRFTLPSSSGNHTFGVLICYEDTDPALSRVYGGGGRAQSDFLINMSNDGWFKGSSEHDQHLAICRFRAVECRRSVARSVNVGISAIIDPCGRVLAPELKDEVKGAKLWEIPGDAGSLPVGRWHEFKQVGGVLVGRVPIDQRESWYARHGDWFAGACLSFLGLWCLGLIAVRRTRSS